MEITGTMEAFRQLINQRGIYVVLGVGRSTVSGWKYNIKNELSGITLDKMEEMLTKAGASVKQERVWEVPENTVPEYKMAMIEAQAKLDDIKPGDAMDVNMLINGIIWIALKNSIDAHAGKINCTYDIDYSRHSKITIKFNPR